MDEDWYIASIDRVQDAAQELHHALDRLLALFGEARRERLAGVDLVEIVRMLAEEGGRDARLASTVAFREVERALTAYRAAVIRTLADQEQMTFTAIGELTGVSRQMIARLYRQAGAGEGDP